MARKIATNTTVDRAELSTTVPKVAAGSQVCVEVRTVVGSRASEPTTACAG